MDILPLNIHSCGRGHKKEWFQQIRRDFNPAVVAIQETKCGTIDDSWMESVWLSPKFKFKKKEAVGFSGVMFLIWDTNTFNANQAIKGEFYLVIKGHWVGIVEEIAIVNVYSPHSHSKKLRFWKELESLINFKDMLWIICGDFNEKQDEKNVKLTLKNWCGSVLKNLDSDITEHAKTFEKWDLIAESRSLTDAELSFWLNERKIWLEKEKLKLNMLKKKARIKWALEGDENTKYFHKFIRHRNNKNAIHGLSINGVWSEDPKEIKDEVFRYYSNLFKRGSSINTGSLNFNASLISHEGNEMLEAPFCEAEIWHVIQCCGSTKSPRRHRFNHKFYTKYFWLIKEDLKIALDWFWSNYEISRGCNASFITLIPKKSNPVALGEYRPHHSHWKLL
ncbi:uncharacterized protein [Rutidosis leptorrhynchoides]|uniref:uncharacterized protein n=1 Tax=Rutidosis leptorrhynchoides TaxID=125765 RepID=UPI003A98D746